ncbi:DUF2971 domain-containing protein [Streptococcus oralis]|uniref:DUF2971 domain-containing protein n=1 Tax=Streptococcus oralis TaxID=1303 RepID=UPI00069FB757|nr:DUF2971 domain-containing protein [Streptococcus oralis]
MTILSDYKSGIDADSLIKSLKELDIEKRKSELKKLLNNFLKLSPKDSLLKLPVILEILFVFHQLFEITTHREVLKKSEKILKDKIKDFPESKLLRESFFWYSYSLIKYFDKIEGTKVYQDFFKQDSLYAEAISYMKKSSDDGIDEDIIGFILSLIFILLYKIDYKASNLQLALEDISENLMSIYKNKSSYAEYIISEEFFENFKLKNLVSINEYHKNNTEDLYIEFYLSWIDSNSLDTNNYYEDIIQSIMKYNKSDIIKTQAFKLLEKWERLGNINIRNSNDLEGYSKQNLKKVANTLIDEIRATLTLDIDDLKKQEKYGHYTKIDTLTKFLIVSAKSDKEFEPPFLRLTHSKQLNDPMEGQALYEYLGLEGSSIDYQSSNVFLSSLTTVSDSLPMWKEYADESQGAFVEYDMEYIQNIVEHDFLEFVKIYYLENDKEDESLVGTRLHSLKIIITELLNKGERKIVSEISSNLAKISYLFKVADYEYESEYRILINFDDSLIKERISTRQPYEHKIGLKKFKESGYEDFRKYIHLTPMDDGRYGLFVYINLLPLRYSKVKLGPKVDDPDYIAPYLKLVDPDIEIESSKIPYR